MNTKDILIVEDDPHTCSFLATAADQTDCFAAIHCAHSLTDAQQKLQSIPTPAMVLCDIGLPDGDGLELLTQAVKLQIPTLIISAMGDEHVVISAIELGASGYLHKDLETNEITAAIQQVLQGGAPLSPSIAGHLLRRFVNSEDRSNRSTQTEPPESADSKNASLTKRETEILQMIARGYLFSEVATELHLSTHTIGSHSRNIYRKLSARSRSEAVFKALKSGLIKSEL